MKENKNEHKLAVNDHCAGTHVPDQINTKSNTKKHVLKYKCI